MKKPISLIDFLANYNKWRVGEPSTMPEPAEITVAIDGAIALIKGQHAEIERLKSELGAERRFRIEDAGSNQSDQIHAYQAKNKLLAEIERLKSEVSDLKQKVSLGRHGFKMGNI